jgi:GMP synthase (glutamine-hydrolysing)
VGHETIAILDFGSQYGQLIARRVREHNVYSHIYPASITAKELSKLSPKGLILSGGPASVYDQDAPKCDKKIFELMQFGCKVLGAEVVAAQRREYGRTNLSILDRSDLFANMPDSTTVWASHGDQVGQLGDLFVKLAATDTCPW